MQILRPPTLGTGRPGHSVPTSGGYVQRRALAGTPEKRRGWGGKERNCDLQEALYLSKHCTSTNPR